MPDFVLGGSTLFVGVYGEVKRADTSLAKLAVSTEQNDQIGRYLSQTGVVLLCNVRGTWIPGRHPRRHRHHRRGEAFHDEPIDLYNGALDLRAASSRVVCVRFARDSSLEGGGFEPSVSVATSEGEVERAQARKTLSLTGTEGSNPPPSSGESRANLTSHHRALAIFGGDRGFESISLQRGVLCKPDFRRRRIVDESKSACARCSGVRPRVPGATSTGGEFDHGVPVA
jgi:hypothetical protein